MAKKVIRSQIRTGGAGIPNPEFIGLHKQMKPLMDKLEELERAALLAAKAYKKKNELEVELEAAPRKYQAARAEALLQGNTALAVDDPRDKLREQIEEARDTYEIWDGPVKSRIRAQLAELVTEHPERAELAESKALEGAEREQELRRELAEIQRNREFSYALLRWLRNPNAPSVGIPGGVREV